MFWYWFLTFGPKFWHPNEGVPEVITFETGTLKAKPDIQLDFDMNDRKRKEL